MIESAPPSAKGRVAIMNMGYCIGPLFSQLTALLVAKYWDGSIMAK